jgi:hypothetical protein
MEASPQDIDDILSEDIENMREWVQEVPQPPPGVTLLFGLQPVGEVVNAEHPERVIPGLSNHPAIAGATSSTVQHVFDAIARMDARPLFQAATEPDLDLRRGVKAVTVLPWQPLGVLGVPVRPECFFGDPGVYIVDLPADLVGPGSVCHCLKSTYTTVRSGMPVILEWEGRGWAFGVLVDKALRRDDVLCQAVAILATHESWMATDLRRLPRWGNSTAVCQGDALVPNLTYALQHTPDDAALLPFRHFCTRVPWPAFSHHMHTGAPFSLTIS